jgi:hypothetical protein
MIPDKHAHLPHTNTQQKSSNYFRSASSSHWHPVSFYPQEGKETDRHTIVCWIFMAVLCCQLLSFPQRGECRLKVNRCVGFCMYVGARHLLCVAWWRTAAPSNETRPILHCDRHLRENYDNELKMVKLEFKSLRKTNAYFFCINPLNAELNPMCHLLILLGYLAFMGKFIVSISNKMQRHTVYLYLETVLYVSGGTVKPV